MSDLLFDRSIIHAYPTIIAPAASTNCEHSKLDFPVVITSSTIRTLEFFLIKKSLLSLNTPFTL